jgi:hypothetical protein
MGSGCKDSPESIMSSLILSAIDGSRTEQVITRCNYLLISSPED